MMLMMTTTSGCEILKIERIAGTDQAPHARHPKRVCKTTPRKHPKSAFFGAVLGFSGTMGGLPRMERPETRYSGSPRHAHGSAHHSG